MKNLSSLLLNEGSVSEIVMGNTALVRAMLETGVRVVSAYPGSPTPEIANAIATIPLEKSPLYFEFSANEKVALEVAFGASINGQLSCVFFKSVGINVAMDSFVQLGMMETIGGMVVVLGDDPGANSSQNEQDNRHFARLSYLPMMEPTSAEEAYEMFKLAAQMSINIRMPVVLRLTTHVCHAKEKIGFAPYKLHEPYLNNPFVSKFDSKNGPYVPITKDVFPLKRKALTKIAEVARQIDTNSKDKVDNNGNPKKGVITAGMPYLSLRDVLEASWIGPKPDILKLDFVYPLGAKTIVEFLKNHEEVKILEELDDYLEQSIKAIAYDHRLKTKIVGKTSVDSWMGEYTADKVAAILSESWPDNIKKSMNSSTKLQAAIPRPAQMCPGCGHRSAFFAIKKSLAKIPSITVADIGCHSLGYLDPYRMGEVLLCMGHVCGTAAGMSINNKDKAVVGFIGDSTFFHAGLPGIVNAVFNKHNFTLVLMENGTTAMTGHQELPSSGRNFREIVDKIPVKRVLEGLGVTQIFEVDAYEQAKLSGLLEQAVKLPGFKVIIAKHPCMLKLTKQNRKKGKPGMKPVTVGEKCNLQKICIRDFACPSYQLRDDGSVFVEKELCIGDGSCKQTCPSGAIV